MNLATAIFAISAGLLLVLVGITRAGVWTIERRNPPSGSFAELGGTRIHFVHVPAPADADLPPIIFIHGASGNLRDQMIPLRPLLEGRAELLFLDRQAMAGRGAAPATRRRPAMQERSLR